MSAWAAVIMAAGQGTRMRSRLPKVAHPLAGRPVVRHVVEAVRAAGVDRIVAVVPEGADGDVVRAACGDAVAFAVQREPRGTAHAVECAREAAGDADNILIMNGDVPLVLTGTLRRLMAALDDGADLAVLSAIVPVESYGFLEIEDGRVRRIVETKGAGGLDRNEPRPINSGQYAARAATLWSRLAHVTPAPNGERYLTALAALAWDAGAPAVVVYAQEPAEVRGINDRLQLAEAEATVRDRVRRAHMLAGVTIADPPTTYIDAGVRIAPDTRIEPQTHLLGQTEIGADCVIGPGAFVRDARIGDRCVVRYSMVEESTLESDVEMGPWSHLRPGSYICEGVHIGNFGEVKASRLGRNTKMGHFSYVGDADVGDDVNIGAGTITANYDGAAKHRTEIGDGAFIGSDTMLVAPVRVGRNAGTSAGSVVNRDVPDGMMAIGAPARIRPKQDGADAPAKEESGPGQ
ncbi:MAG TPA: bifunctional UDP-N-acetylglucosamine diphosphorylase/glucosamine-1-phosphate N-acetyltransferase GlmU [Dehalococcoidia bacterium]|nr:bifunctional UDP-N-acetylglucosamine diphosphorylase/glucosamine-1-phosphate N-acetyltransferase GlmU [Dehalococcoidia bacterium]